MSDPVLQLFEGRWTLTRQIADHWGGQSGHLEGQAHFRTTAIPRQLAYDEEGILMMPGQPAIKATRTYFWSASDVDSTRIDIHFSDGRFFHSLHPQKHRDEAEHLCANDLYKVRYLFENKDKWLAIWSVKGPRKNYNMTSLYIRIS